MDNISERDQISMKLFHYFITKKNYNPIIVQGVENEIWLENMDGDYKVIRIVNNYIHNDEQLNFDIFKTKRMIQKIQKKTFTFNIKVLSILTDVGDNVHRLNNDKNIDLVYALSENDLLNNLSIKKYFRDLSQNMQFTESGFQLFFKITEEINTKNREDAMKNEEIFKEKPTLITYIIIGILALIYLISFINNSNEIIYNYGVNGILIRSGEYYRLLTGTFIHTDIIHLFCNLYALFIIGKQIENFYGKGKFIIIYLISAICGSLLSICMHDMYSIGASGAIFGLLGSLLYFGYHYRVYFGSVIVSKILPIVIINLFIGFMISGIDNFAHIGGLVGGILISMAVGIGNKKNSTNINGFILLTIYIAFLIYLSIFVR